MDELSSNLSSKPLRILGIIVLAVLVIVSSLFLFLLAMCAGGLSRIGGPPNPGEMAVTLGLYLFAFAVLIGGIVLIVRMTRSLVRDTRAHPPQSPPPFS